jgi:hypothetical protein
LGYLLRWLAGCIKMLGYSVDLFVCKKSRRLSRKAERKIKSKQESKRIDSVYCFSLWRARASIPELCLR